MFHSYRTGNKGFTLIEVLIAIALTAVLLGALYTSFFSIERARGSVSRTQNYLEAGKFLDSFSREVRSAFFKAGEDLTTFKGGLTPHGSNLEFTAYKKPLLKSSISLMRLQYEAVYDGGRLLIFKKGANPFTKEDIGAGGIEGVQEFEISYFDGKEWSSAWDAQAQGGLPVAVKAKIKLDDGRELNAMARPMAKILY